MKIHHIEVKDNSEQNQQTLRQGHLYDSEGKIVVRGCLSTVVTKKGEWVRLTGIDRVRWANILHKCPWADVRVVSEELKDEEDRYDDVLDPTIPGAKEMAADSAPKPPEKKPEDPKKN